MFSFFGTIVTPMSMRNILTVIKAALLSALMTLAKFRLFVCGILAIMHTTLAERSVALVVFGDMS